MVNWVELHFQARLHAAVEPGFLAIRHLELVTLNGGHLGYCLHLGIDLATPEGQEAAAFQLALIAFCYELCSQGVGHLPYHPAPLNVGPLGLPAAVAPVPPVAPAVPEPPVDNDFVEVIGGFHPIHGPWVVDHDFVEIIGGVHPVHGPWVEGELPAADVDFDFPAAEIDALAAELLQQPNQENVGEPQNLAFDFDLDLLQ
jgi:hypothetical protein